MGNTLDGHAYRLYKNDPDLTEIHCSEEGIEDIGDCSTELAAAIAHNHTLTFLDLNSTKFNNRDAIQLAKALLLNSSIVLIRLHRNKIGNDGAQALLTAMRHNHTVTTLFLQMNEIEDREITEEIQKLANINKESASPEEAARAKQTLFGAKWAAEVARLRKQAREDFSNSLFIKAEAERERQERLADQQEHATVYERVTGRGHEKKD